MVFPSITGHCAVQISQPVRLGGGGDPIRFAYYRQVYLPLHHGLYQEDFSPGAVVDIRLKEAYTVHENV